MRQYRRIISAFTAIQARALAWRMRCLISPSNCAYCGAGLAAGVVFLRFTPSPASLLPASRARACRSAGERQRSSSSTGERLLNPFAVVLERAAHLDAFQHLVVVLMGLAQVLGHRGRVADVGHSRGEVRLAGKEDVLRSGSSWPCFIRSAAQRWRPCFGRSSNCTADTADAPTNDQERL